MILVAQWVLNQSSASLQRNEPLAVHLFCLLAGSWSTKESLYWWPSSWFFSIGCSLWALKQFSLTQTLATSMQSNCVDFVYYCHSSSSPAFVPPFPGLSYARVCLPHLPLPTSLKRGSSFSCSNSMARICFVAFHRVHSFKNGYL